MAYLPQRHIPIQFKNVLKRIQAFLKRRFGPQLFFNEFIMLGPDNES